MSGSGEVSDSISADASSVVKTGYALAAESSIVTEPSQVTEPSTRLSDPNEDAGEGDDSFMVTLSVYCDTLLGNMGSLARDKRELVPDDGVILAPVEAVAYEGESVFNVLQRELKRARIHLEFVNTPLFNSAYIEGIHNLYEFDAGELSGWVYRVNETYPGVGCSRYKLKAGDAVEWRYSLELGRDLEGYEIEGFQRDE